MYRSFEPQSRQVPGEGEGAYSKQYVTEPSTTQMAAKLVAAIDTAISSEVP
jgi:hypothetical protein